MLITFLVLEWFWRYSRKTQVKKLARCIFLLSNVPMQDQAKISRQEKISSIAFLDAVSLLTNFDAKGANNFLKSYLKNVLLYMNGGRANLFSTYVRYDLDGLF